MSTFDRIGITILTLLIMLGCIVGTWLVSQSWYEIDSYTFDPMFGPAP